MILSSGNDNCCTEYYWWIGANKSTGDCLLSLSCECNVIFKCNNLPEDIASPRSCPIAEHKQTTPNIFNKLNSLVKRSSSWSASVADIKFFEFLTLANSLIRFMTLILSIVMQTTGYKLLIIGHSLGAGVAALIAFLLREQYPQLYCYSFSPPGGLLRWADIVSKPNHKYHTCHILWISGGISYMWCEYRKLSLCNIKQA